MNDILDQMRITLENGEVVLLASLIEKAAKDGKREEYEARRLDTLMRLGHYQKLKSGPITLESIGIKGK